MADRMNFIRRSEAMLSLYAEGKYQQALEVTGELAREFPEEEATTTLWQVCLLSRMGKTEDALHAMRAGLGKGIWWSEQQLREDDDLKPLQGIPAFKKMVAECRELKAAAQKNSKPEIMVRLPASEPPCPLLLALHGAGTKPEQEAHDWGHALAHGWIVAAPQSTQLRSPNHPGWDDRALAMDEVAGHYRQLTSRYPIDPTRVVMAGFSQGGRLAIEMALREMIPVRGFLAVSPASMSVEDLEPLAKSAHGLRGYLVVGGHDPRHDAFPQMHAVFNRSGIPCEIEDHPEIGHEFPADFEKSLDRALRFLLET